MPMTFARRAKRRKRDFIMRQKRRDYVDRRCRRDPSLRFVARDDDAGRIVSLGTRGGRGVCLALRRQAAIGWGAIAGGDFVIGRKLLMSMTFARKSAHGGNGPQQELGQMAEGGGFLARNAA